jgi:hypothetical protein
VTHHQGVVGKAANFILDVAERMKREGIEARSECEAVCA